MRPLLFKMIFSDKQLENDFYETLDSIKGISPLFGNEFRTRPINVPWVRARSLAYGGKDFKTLSKFAGLMSINQNNLMFESSIFMVINKYTDFGYFMRTVAEVTREYEHTLPNRKHNYWNIVYYDKNNPAH